MSKNEELKKSELIKKISHWRQKRQALILAHNYQIPEIQDLADFVGDSLQLARQAAKADNQLIIFCGVHFMAESAAIFSPEKTILIPDPEAGCSLAASIDAATLRKWKKKYPKAVVVTYVNTTAEVKAESDYCCTSTNAAKIVESIPPDREILFVPDIFLGSFVASKTGRDNIHLYPGECHVHVAFRAEDVIRKMKRHPKAEFLIHPECGCTSSCMHQLARKKIPERGTYILSTGGMVKHVKESEAKEFVVATETGILHRLKKENPDKRFIALREDAICKYMKMITLEKLLNSLVNLQFEVRVPKDVAKRARLPIERMLALS